MLFSQIALQVEKSMFIAAAQVHELVYYHPAWSIMGMMLLYHFV